ncbi:MAG TPA: LPS assembly lipoprotein LptE [Gammaproteobacteria bacterium]|nr:LPS assembly lipoprotein LptE [Gammaproteobacteria bacterium]
MRRIVALLAAAMLLSGCGFHLSNSGNLPTVMQRTYLSIPSGNDGLVRELRRNLSSDTTSVVDDPTHATATLSVISAQRLQRVLSVNNLGRPVEEEVAYQVRFSLTSPAGTLIAPETLTLKRNYAYDEANALGNAQQAGVLYANLQRQMARQILFRIEAVGRHARKH